MRGSGLEKRSAVKKQQIINYQYFINKTNPKTRITKHETRTSQQIIPILLPLIYIKFS